jgi:hypothetical protein
MNITLSPDLQERIAENENEFRDAETAISQAIEQGERGEGRPAEDVFKDLRAKYGASR